MPRRDDDEDDRRPAKRSSRDDDDRRSSKKGSTRRGFRKRSPEAVKAAAERDLGSYDRITRPGVKTFKPHDGKNIIRILPPTFDWEAWPKAGQDDHFGMRLWLHYQIGADKQTYLSLHRMKGELDPLEEARAEAQAEGDRKLADALKPRQRTGVWIIDRKAEDEGPQFWAMPASLDKDISTMAQDPDDEAGVRIVDDPDEGCDIRFFKEGAKRNTKYPAAKIKLLSKPLSDDPDLADEWLKYIEDNPLDEILIFHPYKHIAAAFGGQVGSDDDDDDDDGKTRGKRSRRSRDDDDDEKPSRRRSRDDDEDDEKPARSSRRSRDEDEDEEEPRPRRRSRDDDDEKPASRKRSSRDDDEDEDEKPSRSRRSSRDDDDEDDPPPRNRRSTRNETEEDADEEDEKRPAKRSSRARDDDEDEEDEKPSRSKRSRDDDEDEKPKGTASRIRERLAGRRARDED